MHNQHVLTHVREYMDTPGVRYVIERIGYYLSNLSCHAHKSVWYQSMLVVIKHHVCMTLRMAP